MPELPESNPSFEVTVLPESKPEPIGTGLRKMASEIKEMASGGVLGATDRDIAPEAHRHPTMMEELTPSEMAYKEKLKTFLTQNIAPQELSIKTPNLMRDKHSMERKFSKMTLGELRRFWGKKTIPKGDEITPDIIAQLQETYEDISP